MPSMAANRHQYIDRTTGEVRTESLLWDRAIAVLYSDLREHAPTVFSALVGPRATRLLAALNFDFPVGSSTRRFLRSCGVNFDECVHPVETLDTARKLFERQIRWWECRPMPEDPAAVVSPADSRALVGSLSDTSGLFVKNKFFCLEELLGSEKPVWIKAFSDGDFAVFRLTPDKYHYNHTPVAGEVADLYDIPGDYHSCNPGAVVMVATPYSKNRRWVTIIDTDVTGGTKVGLVAMIEVAALMIGNVIPTYSEYRYDSPRPVRPGMFLKKGVPKSLYRPGSSTDVVLFQKGRIEFARDIVLNLHRSGAQSRFSHGFGRPLVETELQVRSLIARRIAPRE
jgi:phosphatidylserine decarboxylase